MSITPPPSSPDVSTGEAASGTRLRGSVRLLRSAPLRASSVLVLAVLLGNALYLLGIRTGDALVYYSGLARPEYGILPGGVNIDPNYGWTSQALGHRAALDWLHGDLPLWNHYEGLGQPLVGEMQSGAFFLPFILLQALPQGILYFHVALELFAGFGMLLLLRSLKLTWTAATTGAVLFALNGIFSVMLNAPFNPVAMLPWILYGVELTAKAVSEQRRPMPGVWITVLSVALTLLAGFPETAALELGLVAVWALVRLAKMPERRVRFAVWSISGALGGLVVASPALVAFLGFLTFGDTGPHQVGSGGVSFQRGFHYHPENIPSFLFPYLHGKLAPATSQIVGVLAGYLTLSSVAVAAIGLLGSRYRLRNAVLALLVAVLLLNQFGATPVSQILKVIPGVDAVLVAKYAIVLIELVVLLWAAEGIDLLQRRRVRWPAVAAVSGVALVGIAAAVVVLRYGDHLVSPTALRTPNAVPGNVTVAILTVTFSAAATVLVLGAVLAARRVQTRRTMIAVAAAVIVAVEGIGIFAVPQLAASPPVPVDTAPVKYLLANLGNSRFFTLGPIQSNYGSYFGAAELNFVDLPAPRATTALFENELKTAATKDYFVNSYKPITRNLPVKDQKQILKGYFARQKVYRSLAVKYLVTRPGVVTPRDAAAHRLTKVFENPTAVIWHDTGAKPFYSVVRGSCRLSDQTLTSLSADCTTPATLVRRELYADGWTAEFEGDRHPVEASGPRFQEIELPSGTTELDFSYVPPYFLPAAIAAVGVLLLGAVTGALALLGRLRTGRAAARP
ncbi:MAG: hypothetical protein ACRDPS_10355 [Nocardioides sp.]|uniref:hypothetical protein n=1 Tax=Nocardioides sp. TaxID=35761 RepID=UPI003D6AA11C